MLSSDNLSSIVTPTPRRVPEPYLRAEIAAFPLASEESFRGVLLELDPCLSDPPHGEKNPTRKLWRACENKFAQHTGWSLDRLVSARDLGWFGSHERRAPVPLHVYLRNLARSHLALRAGVTEIEERTDLAALDAHDHYRWLTLTLPEDLLLAGLGVEPVPRRVDIDPPLLVRRLLDLGVAEIHQHVGASMSFELLWAAALAELASAEIQANELTSPGAPLAEGKLLVRWLLAAAVARCLLAEHIIRGGDCLREFLRKPDFLHASVWTPRRCETLANILAALADADEELLPEIEPLRDLYADIHPTALTLKDDPLQSVLDAFRRCDPIAVRLDLHGENAGERWLLRKALAYLNQPDGEYDKYFARIFWQTVRIRCLYYRTVVERPLTGGLQWFLRFYGRLGKLRTPLYPIMPQVSYHVAGKAGEGHRIKALELRTTAEPTAIGIGEYLLGIIKSWRRVLQENCGPAFEPELGVIVHFAKQRDAKQAWKQGVPPAYWADTYAEPYKKDDADRGRYVSYFAAQSRISHALAEFISAVPSSLWLLRGLDIATDEMGIPTWVFVPLFRHVLDAAAKASIRENAGPPLRVTAHVGEDFRHLLEGMRRIYEQIHYILGITGGRLGHAVALGVEPRTWAESVGSILMPAEERLWDLVWEWRLYSKYRIKPEYGAAAPPGRMDMLLNQVRDLSERIFGINDYRMENLAETHHMLHRFLVPPYVSAPVIDIGFNTFVNAAKAIKTRGIHPEVRSPDEVADILEKYLDNEAIFRRGQQLIDVPIRSDEVAALYAVQYALRRGIAQNGIVVEVNPSSNLLIGDLLDLRNHPILRLFPPVFDADGPPPVLIALGSDDPLTFSTQLLREYTLLHEAACAAGYPERAIQDWLETIRRTGMDARFTKAWRPSAKKKAKILEDELSKYLHMPKFDLGNKP